ncbi:MAG: IS21-like element helper ATPase IstB [Deltaproteobacteria bacterium]|nr:MAG: IS21-like element helper ATPase IstB [Deltaproteobacteria bacterium]
MLTEQTINKLYAMKLNGMAEALKEQLQQPHAHDLSFEERFALLVDRQWTWTENRRMKRLLHNARLKINACIEDIDFRTPRGLDKSVILHLANGDWISNTHNIIITGPTGVGKTYLACALANRACRMGFQSYYIRLPQLFQQLTIARADGSYPTLMKKLLKANVLVIDDLGLAPMSAPERRDLLEVIEDRHGIASTIVAAQLPIEHWHENIRDPTIADAILDRLVHNAHKIHLKGESMRKLRSHLTNENKGGK